MSFFRKIGKHCVQTVKNKRAFSLQLSVLGKWSFFCGHSKWQNTIKIGVSADTGENPKWHFWLQKCHFGKGPRKGFYYLWYLKAVLCWKHCFYSVFSKTQLCRHERAKKHNKNRGGLPEWTKVFFWVLFWVLVVLFFLVSLCFCASVLYTIARNGYFPAFLEVFCLFCSHKRPVLNCLCSSYFAFFCFCLPFQKSIFPLHSCPSTPF